MSNIKMWKGPRRPLELQPMEAKTLLRWHTVTCRGFVIYYIYTYYVELESHVLLFVWLILWSQPLSFIIIYDLHTVYGCISFLLTYIDYFLGRLQRQRWRFHGAYTRLSHLFYHVLSVTIYDVVLNASVRKLTHTHTRSLNYITITRVCGAKN